MLTSNILKATGKFLLTSTLAAALVLTGLHQMFWRHIPLSTPAEYVYRIDGMMGSCSGVMVAPQRMLTAAHCLNLMDLKVDGKDALVLKQNSYNDLALLQVALDCPCVPLSETQFTDVTVVGFPMGLVKLIVDGTYISVLQSDNPMVLEYNGFAVYRANIEGGFSGGGVFQFKDGKWYLVGIVSAGSKTMMITPTVDMIKKILR